LRPRARFYRAEGAIAGIVDPNIDCAEERNRLGNGGTDARAISHVDAHALQAIALDQFPFRLRLPHSCDDVPFIPRDDGLYLYFPERSLSQLKLRVFVDMAKSLLRS
jgi:hypothetical protein